MHRRAGQLLADIRPNARPGQSSPTFTPAKKINSKGFNRRPRKLPPSDFPAATKLADKLVRVVAGTQFTPRRPWKHTETLRGDEWRLLEEVTKNTRHTPKTETQTAFAVDVEDADPAIGPEDAGAAGASIIEAGSLVEVRKATIFACGIVLGHTYMNGRMWHLSLISTGEIVQHVHTDAYIEVPRMVDKDLATRAGTSAIPTNRIETNARVAILKHLREAEKEINKVSLVIGRKNTVLYPHVKAKNPDEWATVSLSDSAKLVSDYRPESWPTLFATHKYIMGRPVEFVPQMQTQRLALTYDVRPENHVVKLQRVVDMVRKRSPQLDLFIEKARGLIVNSREKATESWDEPPSRVVVEHVAFSPDDRDILDVLHLALRRTRRSSADPYSGVVTSIIKRIGLYSQTNVDDVCLRQFLIEMGEVAPWEDMTSQRRELNLDLMPEEESQRVKEHNAVVKKGLSVWPRAKETRPLGPEDFYSCDSVEHLRHDFGNLPVYVVDDVGAEELDDGLSVEPVLNEPGSAWIHVHIADPTSVLPPTHVFAQAARQMGSTAYFIHRTWPMLPPSLTHGRLSLGSLASKGKPEPVLTFSFKVDAEGNMADFDVKAGLIRNITTVDYDSVDKLLGFGAIPVGRPFEAPTNPPSFRVPALETKDVENIRLIHDVILRHRKRCRQVSNPFVFSAPLANLTVPAKPIYGAPPAPISNASYYRGFPSLTYEVSSQKIVERGSRLIIAECMKTASRVASRWFSAKGVPMLRRSARPPIALEDRRDIEKLEAMIDEDGFVDHAEFIKVKLHIPPVEYLLEPGMHWAMGIPQGEGYVRVTSPLRRYNDLVAHWQIKDVLLRPRAHARLFTPGWLTNYAPELLAQEKLQKLSDRSHRTQWALMYIRRFLDHPNPPSDRIDPLQSLSAYITEPGRARDLVTYQYSCHIPSLGLPAIIVTPRNTDIPVGQHVNVRVKDVQVGLKSLLVLELYGGS
ncbi:RNB-domain-containing protein [Rhizopogon vinicolor AM-OR11-026]|uniref:RNB-domain-containing protein n=1 Tax=Rhizopogon vinicolor AM-OR11-026 TaxID=1314800 RepID=A0A1B7NBF2_9AGAM|nr:RNB-domain-containing protein [Rhizopogon vinicolor AM-OR11-026]